MRDELSRVAAAVSVIVASGLTLAACSTAPQTLSPSELIGRSLDSFTELAGVNLEILIQDASPRIGRAASYQAPNDAGWVIVAACSSSGSVLASASVEVAVIPADGYTTGVESDVRAGEWLDAVDCEGRAFR